MEAWRSWVQRYPRVWFDLRCGPSSGGVELYAHHMIRHMLKRGQNASIYSVVRPTLPNVRSPLSGRVFKLEESFTVNLDAYGPISRVGTTESGWILHLYLQGFLRAQVFEPSKAVNLQGLSRFRSWWGILYVVVAESVFIISSKSRVTSVRSLRGNRMAN